MENHPVLSAIVLALIFLLALFVGRLSSRMHIPRVTGYLLTGLATGPSLARILDITPMISKKSIETLQPISELALILILLAIGMRFKGKFFQRWRRQIVIFSATEISLTFGLVFITTFFINIFLVQQVLQEYGHLLNSSLYIGLLLAILAVATAPAATLMVIREYNSEGPVTDVVTTLVGLNNFFAIISFIVASFFLFSPEKGLLTLIIRIAAPVMIGILIGFMISTWAERLELDYEYHLLILGGSIAVLSVCNLLGYDRLLSSFICGVVIANSSPRADNIVRTVRQFDYPLYVIFFVLAGATLHIESLTHIGIIGIVYIAARTAGKFIGCRIGARLGNFSTVEQNWTGFAMVAQAGVAIGLCNNITKICAPGDILLTTIVLGSVVIFELFGPTSIRFGLVRAGEVPLLTLLAKKAPLGSFESLHQVVNFFRSSIGMPSGHKVGSASDILVRHLMRTNVSTVHEDTPFDELLHFIAHSNYDRFPVVDSEDHFVGVIDYTDIRDVLFNPILSNLILAVDLVTKPAAVVNPENTLGEVLEIFKKQKDTSFLMVVDKENQDKLIGIISQNDVLAAFRRFRV